MNYFTRTWHPERYQGHGRKRRYFEGWYYKIVAPEQNLAYAFIPGISMDEHGEQHAFVQVLDGVRAESFYHRFEASEFWAADDKFAVKVGNNYFDGNRMSIRLPDLEVDLDFKVAKRWPKRAMAPGVMGWYGYIPGMQCYHGLVSLHHQLEGTLTKDRQKIDLTSGVGYIEKDWGSGFPNAWVWMQSNHLDHPEPSSLMVSVADIPWLGTSFTGFLSTFLFAGKLYTFATWTGAKCDLHVTDERVRVTLTDKRCKLIVSGQPAAGGDLLSPIQGAMTGKINESLQAELLISFTLDDKEVFRGPAHWSGLEVTENAGSLIK